MRNVPRIAAVFLTLVFSVVASRQLFLFVVEGNTRNLGATESSNYHLLFGGVAVIAACLACALMFRVFQSNSRLMTANFPRVPALPNSPFVAVTERVNSIIGATIDGSRSLGNSWVAHSQANDRMPMDGSVATSEGTPSAKRSFARKSHQAMFKKWSQSKND